MANNPKKISIPGFGPADLITRIKKAKWVPCIPSGTNFRGVSLGGYQLTNSKDFLCSAQYKVIVENLSTGRKFQVIGFGYDDLINIVQRTGSVAVDGEILHKNYVKHYCRYCITVERIK